MIEPVKGDFDQAWELGYEHIVQEGSGLRRLREAYDLSRDDVEDLSGGTIPSAMSELLEDYPGLPEVDQLATLARIFSAQVRRPDPWPEFPDGTEFVGTWSPGRLLDYLLEEVGAPILLDREAGE